MPPWFAGPPLFRSPRGGNPCFFPSSRGGTPFVGLPAFFNTTQQFAKRRQLHSPELVIVRHPVRHFAQRVGPQPIKPIAAVATFGHEARVAQYLQVLRHRWLADLKRLAQRGGGFFAVAQPIEQRPPRVVGDGVEHVGCGAGVRHCLLPCPRR